MVYLVGIENVKFFILIISSLVEFISFGDTINVSFAYLPSTKEYVYRIKSWSYFVLKDSDFSIKYSRFEVTFDI